MYLVASMSWMLPYVGVRHVGLLRAMCRLVSVISRGCYRVWVYDVLCCCVTCADTGTPCEE